MKLPLFVLSFFAVTATIAQPSAFVGKWRGKIAAFNLNIVLNVSEKDGKFVATLDSPDQGATGIPADQVMAKDNTITVSISVIGANYNGVLSADKQTIEGKFNQGGGSFDLVLGKNAIPAAKEKPQTPKPPYGYSSEDVEYDNADKTVHLAGTLTYPSAGSKFPAAILISGSGQQDRDGSILGHRPFAVIADRLTKAGFAVLRVDDRGVGKSTGEVEKASSADFAKDVLTSLEYLKQRKEIDVTRIGLVGHSEGGLIAAIVGAERPDLHFVVLLAAPGIKGSDLLAEQGEQVILSSGASKEAVAAYMPLYRKMIQLSTDETDSLTIAMKAYKYVSEWKKNTSLEYQKEMGLDSKEGTDAIMENLVSGFSAPWMRYFLKSDPSVFLQQISAKVLALNGEKDIQVIASANTDGIKKALQKSKSSLYEVKVLQGLNHLFQKCTHCSVAEYGMLDETFSEDALKEIVEWLQKNVAP